MLRAMALPQSRGDLFRRVPGGRAVQAARAAVSPARIGTPGAWQVGAPGGRAVLAARSAVSPARIGVRGVRSGGADQTLGLPVLHARVAET